MDIAPDEATHSTYILLEYIDMDHCKTNCEKGLASLPQEIRRWLKSVKMEEVDQRPMGRLQNQDSQDRYANYWKRLICYSFLSPEIPARPNGGNDGIASVVRKERNKGPPESSAHVGVLGDGHANVSGAPLGTLKSARQMLRLKLRESRRKRWRSTRILSPPAD